MKLRLSHIGFLFFLLLGGCTAVAEEPGGEEPDPFFPQIAVPPILVEGERDDPLRWVEYSSSASESPQAKRGWISSVHPVRKDRVFALLDEGEGETFIDAENPEPGFGWPGGDLPLDNTQHQVAAIAVHAESGSLIWETVIPCAAAQGGMQCSFNMQVSQGPEVLVYGTSWAAYGIWDGKEEPTEVLELFVLDQETGAIQSHFSHPLGNIRVRAAALMPDGDILVAGHLLSGDFWPTGAQGAPDSLRGTFLIRYSGVDGAYQWHRVFPTVPFGESVSITGRIGLVHDAEGGIYLCSRFHMDTSLDEHPLELVEGENSAEYGDVFLASVSPHSGAVRWARSFGRNGSDLCAGLLLSPNSDTELSVLYTSQGSSGQSVGDEFNQDFRDYGYTLFARVDKDSGELLQHLSLPLFFLRESSWFPFPLPVSAVDPFDGEVAIIGRMNASNVDYASSYVLDGREIEVIDGGTSYHLHIIRPDNTVKASYLLHSQLSPDLAGFDIETMAYGEDGDLYLGGSCAGEVRIKNDVFCGGPLSTGNGDRGFIMRLDI